MPYVDKGMTVLDGIYKGIIKDNPDDPRLPGIRFALDQMEANKGGPE